MIHLTFTTIMILITMLFNSLSIPTHIPSFLPSFIHSTNNDNLKIHSIISPNRNIVAPSHSVIPTISAASSSIAASSISTSSISSIRRKRITFQLGRHILMSFSQHFDEFLHAHCLLPLPTRVTFADVSVKNDTAIPSLYPSAVLRPARPTRWI